MSHIVLIHKAAAILSVLIGIFTADHASAASYYVSTTGSDSNTGTVVSPWKTIQKGVRTVKAGDTVYVRGGKYAEGIRWIFANSGTASQPITLTNYPGEQVVFKLNTAAVDNNFFHCNFSPVIPESWKTTKADHIRIIGTDVTPATLSNGVVSSKGIVMQGLPSAQSSGILAWDCDYWEVAGVDFVEMSNGIFTFKESYGTYVSTTDHWYVHNNRVYVFYRESGMQFNGDYNRIEFNEIYKVTNTVATPYGCQMLNLLGNNNIVKGNIISRLGSAAECYGVYFEWDMADANLIEQNRIYDVSNGMQIQGGDNNTIRNNVIYGLGNEFQIGIQINSYDGRSTWPCDEAGGPLEPPNNPSHPDYQYYYNPRNCHSYGNKIYNNTIHGFVEGIRFYPAVGENTVIRNNAFSGWTRGPICHYSSGSCLTLPGTVTVSNNVSSGSFGFVNLATFDFHLAANSPLIDRGYNLGSLVPNDFEGNMRPQGAGFDVGAYEASQLSSPLSPAPPTNLTVK